jgi:hypothetical protein
MAISRIVVPRQRFGQAQGASLQSLLVLLPDVVLVFLKHTVDAVPGVVVQTSQVPNRLRAFWLCVIAFF